MTLAWTWQACQGRESQALFPPQEAAASLGAEQARAGLRAVICGPVWLLGPAAARAGIFSRYVTGWMVATRESAALAERLISETCARQQISSGQLADLRRGDLPRPLSGGMAEIADTRRHEPLG